VFWETNYIINEVFIFFRLVYLFNYLITLYFFSNILSGCYNWYQSKSFENIF